MKVLWAPWRIEYITAKKDEGCVFCSASNQDDDKKNLILYKGETCFIIMNRYPYSNGHLMAVPYRHTSDLRELGDSERLELINLTGKCLDILNAINPDGYNLGMNIGREAGAGIDDHLHFHIVPRWSGDTNFMPLLADTKIMPEYLESTYDTLLAELKNIER